MQRHYATLAVVAVVVVAGCPLGGSGAAPDTSDFEYPDGFSPDGITNATTAIQSHVASLDEPYRVTFLLSQSGSRGKAVVNGSITAVPDAKRSVLLLDQRSGQDLVRLQTFHAGEDRYVHRATGSEFSTQHLEKPFQRPVYPDRETFTEMLGNLELNATDVRTHNGTQVVVYTVTNVSSDRLTTKTAKSRGNLTVDSDGRIHSIDVQFTQFVSGVDRDVTFEYATRVDANLTVDRPEWAD